MTGKKQYRVPCPLTRKCGQQMGVLGTLVQPQLTTTAAATRNALVIRHCHEAVIVLSRCCHVTVCRTTAALTGESICPLLPSTVRRVSQDTVQA